MTPDERQYEADLVAEIVQLKAERNVLRARVSELESALRFYADKQNWLLNDEMISTAESDCGDRARAALEGKLP